MNSVIHSHASTYTFTIDKRPDLWYGYVCYLERTSLPPPAAAALTLDPSRACSLFVALKKVNSFGIKQIQPLLPKHPGWGYPRKNRPVESATYSLLFPDLVMTQLLSQSSVLSVPEPAPTPSGWQSEFLGHFFSPLVTRHSPLSVRRETAI